MISRDTRRKGATDWTLVDTLTDVEIEAAVRDDPDAVPLDIDWASAVVVLPRRKKAISIRLDDDVLDFFKQQGGGYQGRMNAVLRTYMQHMRRARRRS